MIEFNEDGSGTARAIVLNVDAIETFEPVTDDLTSIVLKNGRTLMASLPYAEVRWMVVEARSQFVSAL